MSMSSGSTPRTSSGHTALISADKVQGTDVYNQQGDHLGHIEDVILHKISGEVVYAVMAFGGFLGIGERYTPVPWNVLKYDTDKDGYMVPLNRETLEQAPNFTLDELSGDDGSWGDSVSRYFDTGSSRSANAGSTDRTSLM